MFDCFALDLLLAPPVYLSVSHVANICHMSFTHLSYLPSTFAFLSEIVSLTLAPWSPLFLFLEQLSFYIKTPLIQYLLNLTKAHNVKGRPLLALSHFEQLLISFWNWNKSHNCSTAHHSDPSGKCGPRLDVSLCSVALVHQAGFKNRWCVTPWHFHTKSYLEKLMEKSLPRTSKRLYSVHWIEFVCTGTSKPCLPKPPDSTTSFQASSHWAEMPCAQQV